MEFNKSFMEFHKCLLWGTLACHIHTAVITHSVTGRSPFNLKISHFTLHVWLTNLTISSHILMDDVYLTFSTMTGILAGPLSKLTDDYLY